jgi:predicted Zn-dependent protease
MTDRWTYADGKVFDGNGILLAHVVYDPQTDFRRNCRMISVAPEMLDLLMEAVARVEMGHDLTCTGWSDKAMDLVRGVDGESEG